MNKFLIGLVVVLLLAAGGLLIWQNLNQQTQTNEPIFCAADVKLCSDGSYVARVAPTCEFAACPLPLGWKTLSTDGFELQYPETLTTKYIDAFEWPPKVTIVDGEFSCAETPAESSLPSRIARRTVDDRVYCVEAMSEGAAGSTYTTYTYTTARAGKLISLNFVLRYPQCLNYADQTILDECTAEREAFDLDGVIDRIVETVRLK